jgi:hypothetical protein
MRIRRRIKFRRYRPNSRITLNFNWRAWILVCLFTLAFCHFVPHQTPMRAAIANVVIGTDTPEPTSLSLGLFGAVLIFWHRRKNVKRQLEPRN